MDRGCYYLAGPMRGYDQFNFPRFFNVAMILRNDGYRIISPAEHDVELGFDYTKSELGDFNIYKAMSWDLTQILQDSVSGIILLEGWEKSKGALLEKSVCEGVGKEVLYWNRMKMATQVTPVKSPRESLHSAPEIQRKDTNPKDRAASSRIDLSLVPDSGTVYAATAFTEGDLKYGAYNWRAAGVQASVYIGALRRHVGKWWNGEDFDPKTNVHHLGNALACLYVLVDAIEQGNLNDDRPPKQSTDLYKRAEEIVKYLQNRIPRQAERYREQETEYEFEGYCLKDRKKVQVIGANLITMRNGKPCLVGECPECQTKIYKIGAVV